MAYEFGLLGFPGILSFRNRCSSLHTPTRFTRHLLTLCEFLFEVLAAIVKAGLLV